MDGQYPPSLPTILSTGVECLGNFLRPSVVASVNPAVGMVSPANEARYMPLRMNSSMLVKALFWANGNTATGNVDVGIYTSNGKLITSTGTRVQTTANTIQSVTLGTPVLIPPGFYYLAYNASSTSTTGYMVTLNNAFDARRMGIYTQTSAFPLPATATFANPGGQLNMAVVGMMKGTLI